MSHSETPYTQTYNTPKFNRVKCLVSLTPSCLSLLCSQGLTTSTQFCKQTCQSLENSAPGSQGDKGSIYKNDYLRFEWTHINQSKHLRTSKLYKLPWTPAGIRIPAADNHLFAFCLPLPLTQKAEFCTSGDGFLGCQPVILLAAGYLNKVTYLALSPYHSTHWLQCSKEQELGLIYNNSVHPRKTIQNKPRGNQHTIIIWRK